MSNSSIRKSFTAALDALVEEIKQLLQAKSGKLVELRRAYRYHLPV
jgi:hypothetical protein